MAGEHKAHVLIAEYDPIVQQNLREILREQGHVVTIVHDSETALQFLDRRAFDVLMMSAEDNGNNGARDAMLAHLRDEHPDLAVLLLTGYGEIESAVEALKFGAFGYLSRPVIEDEVHVWMQRVMEDRKLREENAALRSELAGQYVPVGDRTLAEALEHPEREIIRTALESNDHSRKRTAVQLGIDRTTLYKKMRKYQLLQ